MISPSRLRIRAISQLFCIRIGMVDSRKLGRRGEAAVERGHDAGGQDDEGGDAGVCRGSSSASLDENVLATSPEFG